MRNWKCLILLPLSLLFTTNIYADTNSGGQRLYEARKLAVTKYLGALKNTDAKQIAELFTPDGVVVSTSVGRAKPQGFFTSFFSELKSADVSIGNIYKNTNSDNTYGASFYFSWTSKQNKTSGGYYMDEFVFSNDSDKLKTVYMYENTKM